MRKTLLIAITILCCIAVHAQEAKPTPETTTFADMKWGTPIAEVKRILSSKGFTTNIDDEGDLRFEGTLMSVKSVGFALMTEGKLSKVIVNLATPEKDARKTYTDMKEVLTKKYGEPSKCFEYFSRPYYEGDGYEEQAIRVGKGVFACFWNEQLISVEITDKLIVRIAYESQSWSQEADRRKAKKTSIF